MKNTITLSSHMHVLADEVKKRKLVPVFGSGISTLAPSNIPTWVGFCKETIRILSDIKHDYRGVDHGIDEIITRHFLRDASKSISEDESLPQVFQAIKSIARQLSTLDNTNALSAFDKKVYEIFAARQPNRNHRLIADTHFPSILTTNYDTLIEEAQKGKNRQYPSFSFGDERQWALHKYKNRPVIAHLHGSCSKGASSFLDNIVLTASDYNGLFAGRYATFYSLAMAEFVTNSVIFIGYGGRDPHMELLLHKIANHLGTHFVRNGPQRYIVLKENEVNAIHDEYRTSLGCKILTIKDYTEIGSMLRHFSRISPKKRS